MKKYALEALLVVTWLMLMPPPKMPPVKDAHGNYEVNLKMPVNHWVIYATYRNENACRGDLQQMPKYFVCIDRNSPALRRTAAAPRTRTFAPKPAPPPQKIGN